MITSNSARTLNIQEEYGIEEGKRANLIILPAENGYDAIRRQTPILYSIRDGKVLAKTEPSITTINIDNKEMNITFKK